MLTTINISLPKNMYQDVKKLMGQKGYTSVSEFIRDALRERLYPNLTENGFTPEFEDEVLRIANNPNEEYIEWDGKTPFAEFVLSHPPKNYKGNGQNKVRGKLLSPASPASRKQPGTGGYSFCQS